MHRIVYQDDEFIVKDTNSGYYTYSRYRKNRNEHTHIKTKRGYLLLLECIRERKIPDSEFLRESILRICKRKEHQKLVRDVKHKIAKDKDKDYYINVGGGMR